MGTFLLTHTRSEILQAELFFRPPIVVQEIKPTPGRTSEHHGTVGEALGFAILQHELVEESVPYNAERFDHELDWLGSIGDLEGYRRCIDHAFAEQEITVTYVPLSIVGEEVAAGATHHLRQAQLVSQAA